eukprot:528297_1
MGNCAGADDEIALEHLAQRNTVRTMNSFDLSRFLARNNLLKENAITEDILKNDIKLDEMDEFCKEFQIHGADKKNLTDAIKKLQAPKEDVPTMNVTLIGEENSGKETLKNIYLGKIAIIKEETTSNRSKIKIQIQSVADYNLDKSATDVVMVCYDIENKQTLSDCTKKIESMRDIIDDMIVFLVGCSEGDVVMDRILEDEQIEGITNKRTWKSLNVTYFKCSIKTGENVRNIFVSAAEIYQQNNIIKTMSASVTGTDTAWLANILNIHRKLTIKLKPGRLEYFEGSNKKSKSISILSDTKIERHANKSNQHKLIINYEKEQLILQFENDDEMQIWYDS